jgi:outer membrane receptor protein involved in Fe transport
MVYFTVARGYRPGGVNATVPPVYCAAGIAALGQQPPSTYKSDTVMSYEGGAKVRVFGDRAQVNTSVFYIDWNDIQMNAAVPGCPFSYVANAGKAVSKGFDLQSNARLGGGFTGNLGLGYTDAAYSQTTFGPPKPGGAPPAILVNRGDQLPVAPWNASVGLQYDTTLMGRYGAYARIDYQYASSYHRTVGAGATGYTPETYLAPETRITNIRIGTAFDGWDLSLFANNLFDNYDKILDSTGRSSCANVSCSTYAFRSYLDVYDTFRPRTVGITAVYRY